jgi:hypothetical protein
MPFLQRRVIHGSRIHIFMGDGVKPGVGLWNLGTMLRETLRVKEGVPFSTN